MMTQEEAKRIPVCARCKWCIIENKEHQYWNEYQFLCKNAISTLDPIKGDEVYMNCLLVNGNADCKNFELPKKSWIERFLDALTGKNKEK